ADGRAQINVFLLKSGGPHLAPPVEVIRQPLFQRALQARVFSEIDVVRDAVIEGHGSFSAISPRSHTKGHERNWVAVFVFLRVTSRMILTFGGNRTSVAWACRNLSARRVRRPRWGAGRPSFATPSIVRRFWFPSSPGPRIATKPP